MGAVAASRAVLVIIGAALVFAGAGFAGYAVMLLLAPKLGAAGSAGAAAGALLIVPLGYLLVASFRRPPPLPAPVLAQPPETTVLSALALVAQHRPFLAVLGAGLLGATDVLLKAPGRRRPVVSPGTPRKAQRSQS